MGRPPGFDKEAAIERVMHRLWRDGYAASSVKALSEMLGISRSSFYNAFGSREDAFRAALALYFSRAPDHVLATATPDMPVRRLFTSVFRAVCKARAADPEGRGCLAVNSVSELCNADAVLGPLLEEAVREALFRIEAILHRGVETGELDPATDVHATALAIQNLLMGLNVMSKVVREEADLLAAAETTLAALDLLDRHDDGDRNDA